MMSARLLVAQSSATAKAEVQLKRNQGGCQKRWLPAATFVLHVADLHQQSLEHFGSEEFVNRDAYGFGHYSGVRKMLQQAVVIKPTS